MTDRSLIPFHPLAEIFPLLTGQEYTDLVDDIRTCGLRHPIVLFEGKILDGRNRYFACQDAGVAPAYALFTGTVQDAMRAVWSENLIRRHLDAGQRAAAWKKRELLDGSFEQQFTDHVKAEAKANQGMRTDLSQLFEKGCADHNARSTLQKRATAAGVNRQYLADIDRIHEKKPALLEDILYGRKSLPEAKRELRRAVIEDTRAALLAAPPPFPPGKFGLIYADPPWRYECASVPANHDIENHYPTMALDEICAMPVDQIVQDDCVLYLWVPNPKLEEGIQVTHAWGFDYRTNMVWVKDRIGLGYYARQQHELLLIAVRGNPKHPDEAYRPSSVIHAPRTTHSAKPPQIYALLNTLYPGVPKVELFARQPHTAVQAPWWAFWGNEISLNGVWN